VSRRTAGALLLTRGSGSWKRCGRPEGPSRPPATWGWPCPARGRGQVFLPLRFASVYRAYDTLKDVEAAIACPSREQCLNAPLSDRGGVVSGAWYIWPEQ